MNYFFIPGQPKAQPRTKSTAFRSKEGKITSRVYTPKAKTEEWREAVRDWARVQEPIDGPVEIYLGFYFERPKSHYRAGKYSNLLKDSAPMHHMQKPDADNLAKLVLDEFQSLGIIDDDASVVLLSSSKRWVHTEGGCLVGMRCPSEATGSPRLDANAKDDPSCGCHTASKQEDSNCPKEER